MARARPDSESAEPGREVNAVTAAIRAESRLTQEQKEALLAVYSSYLAVDDTHHGDGP